MGGALETEFPTNTCPEGPSTQYSRTMAPKTIEGVVLGTRDLKYLGLGSSGLGKQARYEAPGLVAKLATLRVQNIHVQYV